MPKIFISYSRQSEAMARNLVNDIESLGSTVWFDQELSGGQAWWDHILAMIRDCDVFVFLLDSNALNSTACKQEFGYADDLGKPILPVLVAEGVSTNLLPPELSRLQFVDYRKHDRNTAFSLARALASIPPAKPLPNPLPSPPEAPVSYLGNLTRKIDTASALSYEEQSALMVDLRRSLRDPEAGNDARTLLKKLRNRRDLFAAIAEEIDDSLGSPRQASSVPPRTSVPESPLKVDIPQQTVTPRAPSATQIMTRRERLLGALVGAALGAVGAIAIALPLIGYRGDDLIIGAVFAGIGGAIAGAISATDKRVIATALAGLALGFIIWVIADSDQRYRIVRATFLGAPLGAILGSLLGALIKRKKA